MKGDLWGLFLITEGSGGTRESVLKSHGVESCRPNACPLHAPSNHHMQAWRLHWRAGRRRMERVCPAHGVGHPDPDHLGYVARRRGAEACYAESVHGCCGCCVKPEEGADE